MADSGPSQPAPDWRPVPDPTALTNAAVKDMADALRREMAAQLAVLETRLEGMDRATALIEQHVSRVPSDADKQIENLREVHEEKFRSIQIQFSERDTRTEQTSRDSKVAVDAALQAAKEAVGEQNKSSALAIAKSETATTKQIDQIGTLLQTTTKAIDDKFDDLKQRLTRLESEGRGKLAAESTQHTSSTYTAQLVGIAIGLVGVIAAVIVDIISHHP